MIIDQEFEFVYSKPEEELAVPVAEKVMKEYRCYQQGNLLCKASGEGQIEIVNPKNRVVNYVGPSRKAHYIGPMGQQFSQFCTQLYCKGCKRLQARAIGTDLTVEIKCSYCNATTLHSLEQINKPTTSAYSSVQLKQYYDNIRRYLGIL